MINALNSGARTFMADFEDSNCPTFPNMLEVPHQTLSGPQSLTEAASGISSFQRPSHGSEVIQFSSQHKHLQCH